MKDAGFMIDLDATILFLGTDYMAIKLKLKELYEKENVQVVNSGIFSSIDEAKELLTDDETKKNKIVKAAYRILDEEEIKGAKKSKLREGSIKLLEFLKPFGPVLVSSNCRKSALIAFETLKIEKEIFSKMIMREDVKNLKPDPEPILKAIEFLKSKNPNVRKFAHIGDHKNDILAVNQANNLVDRDNPGIKMISIAGGATPDIVLEDLNGSNVAYSMAEVLEKVMALLGER